MLTRSSMAYFVEGDRGVVPGAYLQVEFRATRTAKTVLDGRHQMACDARAPLVRIGRNLVDPAAYTLEARDGGADNRTVQLTDEEEFRLDATLDADEVCGCVPGWVVREHTIQKPHDSVVNGGPVHAH